MSISKSYKRIAVAYHETIKRINGLNKWDENHLACDMLNVSIFEHLLAKRIATLYRRTISSTGTISLKKLTHFHFSQSLLAVNLRNFLLRNILRCI